MYHLENICSEISNLTLASQSTEHYGHQVTRIRQNCKMAPGPRKTCCVLTIRKVNVLF